MKSFVSKSRKICNPFPPKRLYQLPPKYDVMKDEEQIKTNPPLKVGEVIPDKKMFPRNDRTFESDTKQELRTDKFKKEEDAAKAIPKKEIKKREKIYSNDQKEDEK